ncbi:MAG TPA: hypothetical protein VFC44_09200 [Candidatus Saccharimonadales bacterium]|nr:hypothetical protein [Candidatus Saccharimonadales bacterium]
MNWTETILAKRPPEEIWKQIFDELLLEARATASPVALHQSLVPADRLLAEAAWELWEAYQVFSGRTSLRLVDWWNRSAAGGRAVLVLDALSLRDLPALLGGAQTRNIVPAQVSVTGAEVPSDTTPFAKALGVPTRASLKSNRSPGTFLLQSTQLATDVLNVPFADCAVPSTRDVFIWHEWQDADVHGNRPQDAVFNHASTQLQSDDFWAFVNRLRQGRKLVITADHGYATSAQFATTLENEQVVDRLKETFSAQRLSPSTEPWTHPVLPPVVLSANGYHVVMGQVKWRIQSGFPPRCHGGLTLLEVAVPFVELPSLP